MISIFNLTNIMFSLVILHTKSVEDYIAKFSQHDTLRIVSIYQRRILDTKSYSELNNSHISGGSSEKDSYKVKHNAYEREYSIKSSYMSTTQEFKDDGSLLDKDFALSPTYSVRLTSHKKRGNENS